MRLSACCVILPLVLAACGDPTPQFGQRGAADWVEQLWSPDATKVEDAIGSLVRLAQRPSSMVVESLEARMRLPPPAALGAPFTVLVDFDGAKRLGFEVPSVGDTAVMLQPVLLSRVEALGFAPVSVRAMQAGEIDIVVSKPFPRADVERLQAALCRRTAVELRLVVVDPSTPRPEDSLRGTVYDDAMPYAQRLAAETKRFRDAQAAEKPYVPESRWRVVPRASASSARAETLVLVEEPTSGDDVLDERLAETSAGTATGREAVVVVSMRPERAAAATRFFRSNTGLELATILDGEVVARSPMPPTDGTVVRIPFGPAPPDLDAGRWAKDIAAVLPMGRMPLPLKPAPISERYGTDPVPDNAFSRLLVLLGAQGTPLVERIGAGDFPSWAKASAAWARLHAMDVLPPGR